MSFSTKGLMKINSEISQLILNPQGKDAAALLDEAETKLFDITQGNLKKSSEAAHNLVTQALKKIEETIIKKENLHLKSQ